MEFFVLVGLLVLGFLAAAILKSSEARATRERFWEATTNIINSHERALGKRRSQLVRVDDYGVEIDKAWRKEMKYFIEKVIEPKIIDPIQKAMLRLMNDEIQDEIERVAKQMVSTQQVQPAPELISPIEFERQCEAILNEIGWSARLTPATGDQGADVVAVKNNETIVIQCKLYSRPVGNKAVQEVVAARSYYVANHAAVVATIDYTEAARRLARSNRVYLLHVDELRSLDKKLRDAVV